MNKINNYIGLNMYKTRPTMKSESVASAVYFAYENAIQKHFPHHYTEDSFKSHMILAIMESLDSYQITRYMDDFYEWPCSRSTITLFDNIYFDLIGITKDQTTEWVVKTGIRPKNVKGDAVTFAVNPDVFLTGQVSEVLPQTARLIVEVPKTGIDEVVLMTVNVEDIVT